MRREQTFVRNDHDLYRLVNCSNALCARIVREGVLFCCPSCAAACDGGYEIDKHETACDERQAARHAAELDINWTSREATS